jgi:hypothetical protein
LSLPPPQILHVLTCCRSRATVAKAVTVARTPYLLLLYCHH